MIHLYRNVETEREVLTVSQLNRLSRALLEDAFPQIWVEGEISNLSRPSSGHLYFSLKDASAQIRCAFFHGRQMHLPFALEDGQHVLVRAKVSLYEGRGDYQLIIEGIELTGDGALLKAFEKLKQKLAAQGLFDTECKKAIPTFPKCVGVVTSASGAAIKDVLSVLKRRFPAIPIIIYPTPVQGEKAAAQIITALSLANSHKRCDVLILVRGGGSLEDLWCFNDEKLAHSIVKSHIPIVTGIGHEIDFTIADFAADYRAPTPSAAAEFISPNQLELENLITTLLLRLIHLQKHKLQNISQRLQHLIKLIPHPKEKLLQLLQRCDYLELKTHQIILSHLALKQKKIEQLALQINHLNPQKIIHAYRKDTAALTQRLQRSITAILKQKKLNLQFRLEKLDLASPLKTLGRGYSITQDKKSGKLISSVKKIHSQQRITIKVSDGEFEAEVK